MLRTGQTGQTDVRTDSGDTVCPPPIENGGGIKTTKWMASSVDPHQMPHSATSDLSLNCLLRPVSPIIQGKYGMSVSISFLINRSTRIPSDWVHSFLHLSLVIFSYTSCSLICSLFYCRNWAKGHNWLGCFRHHQIVHLERKYRVWRQTRIDITMFG